MPEGTVRAHVTVRGRVQGVWFRQSTAREALALGLTGWVRNLADGSVEAVFEGDPDAVETAVDYAGTGPERAVVESCDVTWEDPAGETAFLVRD
jgi:acylphosphatase